HGRKDQSSASDARAIAAASAAHWPFRRPLHLPLGGSAGVPRRRHSLLFSSDAPMVGIGRCRDRASRGRPGDDPLHARVARRGTDAPRPERSLKRLNGDITFDKPSTTGRGLGGLILSRAGKRLSKRDYHHGGGWGIAVWSCVNLLHHNVP